MPALYDLPRTPATWEVEDVNRFQKLPYYLALLQSKMLQYYKTYGKLVKSIPWQQNQGTTMRTVRVEPSPIGRQQFFPNAITTAPKKDLISQMEVTEEGLVRRHYFESRQFSFLPSFQDFRRDQIPAAMKDIARQQAAAEDFFIRSFLFHRAPYVYLPGRVKLSGSPFSAVASLVAAPSGDGNDAGTTGKIPAFLQQCMAELSQGARSMLGFTAIHNLLQIARSDLQIPPFEGMTDGAPADNEVVKGNYVIVGNNEVYESLGFDPHVLSYKNLSKDLINSEFTGKVLGSLIYKSEAFPLRIASDGTFPAPQIYESNEDAYNYGETIPNPDYVSAQFEVAFFMAGESAKNLSVGPAPADFASGKMSSDRFNKLMWNGESKLTDNILINSGTAADPVWDTNKYGEFVQIINGTNFAILSVNRRHVIPVIYKRWRANESV